MKTFFTSASFFILLVFQFMPLAFPVRLFSILWADEPSLRVCTTTPDLKSIALRIGGERIKVASFARGPEDPHFVEVKPSYLKLLHECDLFLQVGLELEIGWAAALLQNARNPRLLPGAMGFLSLEQAVTPLEVPSVAGDRSMGDLHPRGNPHYLLDPVNGILVARAIAEKLVENDPQGEEYYRKNLREFEKDLLQRLVGDKLLERFGVDPLLEHLLSGDLIPWLEAGKATQELSGWLKELQPYRGSKVVSDHNLWVYFSRRFGIDVVAHLEPKPGIDPSTSHLKKVVEIIQRQGVKVLLSAPYFDTRFARSVAEKTGVKILPMAHQTGAYPEATEYLSMLEYNVRTLRQGLASP